MKKRGKRYNQLLKNYDPKSAYPYKEAIEIVKKNATAKFDESFEVAMRLGVDPRKADQLVRGTVTLPHGTGRKVRVLVLCKVQEIKRHWKREPITLASKSTSKKSKGDGLMLM